MHFSKSQNFLMLFSLLLCVLLVSQQASADLFTAEDSEIYGDWVEDFKGYVSPSDANNEEVWSGYFIGLFEKNDSENDMKLAAEDYLYIDDFDSFWDKVDPVSSTGTSDGENGYLSATATVFKDQTEPIAGTWSVITPYALGFYSVKGDSNWALYYVNPYQSSGYWSTIHLSNASGKPPEISHLSALPEITPVPEPATMLLLGLGLVGITGASRKKIFKKS